MPVEQLAALISVFVSDRLVQRSRASSQDPLTQLLKALSMAR
jgi:hypothetical protein